MATLKEIQERIKSVKNTQKITKAMKMVAAAKMRRAQEQMFLARPYASKIQEMVYNLAQNVEGSTSPLLQERKVERTALIVVTSDRGLCGSFNANSIKMALTVYDELDTDSADLICLGRKGAEFFKKRAFNVTKDHSNIFNKLVYSDADQVASELIKQFVDGEIDAVKMVFNEFKSVARQELVVQDLLPFKMEEDVQVEEQNADYIFEPSQVAILEALLPKYIKVQVWQALLESYASEQAARMMAMENATENANDLIRSLTLQFNKARQAAITTEILEIVSGAEALKSA